MEDNMIDCRSEIGETIALIDAAIIALRMASRSKVIIATQVKFALIDLCQDPEIQTLMKLVNRQGMMF